jgi:hypothetical protein
MLMFWNPGRRIAGRTAGMVPVLLAALFTLMSSESQALPVFARQTGQNCVACHAGGQFPELTPYGRMFKLTGYTIGQRTVPVSVMGLASSASVRDTTKSDDPAGDFQKNGKPILATGSLFLAGKVTDNIGAFVQLTYDNFASPNADGTVSGHTNVDNVDIRYADRFVDANRDLIVGISANNNPSVSDPWNTAAAWMQYVPVPSPSANQFIDGTAPYPGYSSGGNVAGISAYFYLNKMLYGELGGYRTADQAFSFMSGGTPDEGTTKLKGLNPYWRLALTHEWGAHNIMVGTSGMVADIYDSTVLDPTVLTSHFTDVGVDAQYQYLLAPHTVTAQVAYMRNRVNYSDSLAAQAANAAFVDSAGNPLANTNTSDTTNTFRAKLSYVYQATYGGSLGFFNKTGTTNTALQTAVFDATNPGTVIVDPATSRVNANLSGNPATRGWTYEAFWTPVQYIRVGAQFTAYDLYNGSSTNYDGLGRNAKDNNSLFLYVWAAY